MRPGRAVSVLGAALLLAGCSSSSPSPAAGPSVPAPLSPISAAPSESTGLPASATLRCADAISNAPPAAGLRPVAGVVAFPDLTSPALSTSRTGESGALRLFAKSGLVVAAGQSMVIAVADPAHAALGWGSPGQRAGAVIVPGCGDAPASSADSLQWLVFAGGYYVDRPQCLGLVVTRAGKEHTVRIGVGAPCPGQQPPPSGSEG